MGSVGTEPAVEPFESIYEPPEIITEKIDGTACLVAGVSPEMQNIIKKLASRIASSDVTVLLLGESGSGKEVLARFIHSRSKRQNKQFFAINCAALPENLIETELFGCEQGAYTDATKKRIGIIEAVNEGTLFLDEIEAASPSLQRKLLRVIESKEIQRVGGVTTKKVDVRFIAASNINLKNAVNEKNFREDLFFRLTYSISIPPLRYRVEDIPFLAYHILFNKTRSLNNSEPWRISNGAMLSLQNSNWRGNVRELDNVITQAVFNHFDENNILLSADVDPFLDKEAVKQKPALAKNTGVSKTLKEIGDSAKEEAEKSLVRKTLEETNWNRTEASRKLRISYKTLRNKLQTWGWRET
ncbi:MAG: sigma-54 dependent transcriptional regulator [Patescibacteria group bacterium]